MNNILLHNINEPTYSNYNKLTSEFNSYLKYTRSPGQKPNIPMYQFRHPDVVQTARTIFLVVGITLILETLGEFLMVLMTDKKSYYILDILSFNHIIYYINYYLIPIFVTLNLVTIFTYFWI